MKRATELAFEPVEVKAPFRAYRAPCDYPLAERERSTLVHWVVDFARAVAGSQARLHPTLWLDTRELHRDGGAKLYSKNAGLWSPFMGFAFDPTGEPPRGMDPKDIMDMEWGAQVKTFMRSAIALRNTAETLSAYRLLAGRGLSTLLFFPESGVELRTSVENFADHSCEVFRPMMHDGAFQSFGFYLPLLSSENLAKAHAEKLAIWLGDAVIYFREAFEAHEVLLLARCDLESAFEKLQMVRQEAAASQAGWMYDTLKGR